MSTYVKNLITTHFKPGLSVMLKVVKDLNPLEK